MVMVVMVTVMMVMRMRKRKRRRNAMKMKVTMKIRTNMKITVWTAGKFFIHTWSWEATGSAEIQPQIKRAEPDRSCSCWPNLLCASIDHLDLPLPLRKAHLQTQPFH